ncbi:MAG: FAD-dependent oxidoreductase [Gemmatimonadaceae bacterium]|nr:FAD-dependent oxidoreductase [Gemmatimonadaceae bacterium]
MNRRTFLATGAALPWLGRAAFPVADERRADVVIIGGGLGGCAAALAATARGLRVTLTEPTAWIGGQLTAQAVPPDENAWIETIGGTATYRELRTRVRAHYRAMPALRAPARDNPRLNPGNGWVSRLCAEPVVWHDTLRTMLAPALASGRLTILLETTPIAADVERDQVRAVTVRTAGAARDTVLRAPWFVDATELGDLLPLTNAEHVMGAEARRDTGEPHAAEVAQPDNQQSFTVVFAMEYRAGEDHTITRPDDYARWRDHTIAVNGTAYRQLSFDEPANAKIGFDPEQRTGYWSYRRILDRTLFAPDTLASDVTLVNWWQNDYAEGPLCGVPAHDAAQHLQAGKALSRALLYWLQTEALRPDGGTGWRGLRLRPDIVGTADGLAMAPYVRESRRIRAITTIREQDVLRPLRMEATGASAERVTATPFGDSVGIGHYAMDLHRTTRGDTGGYGDTLPFQIPLGALLPVRLRNLLPACKNIGTTHLTNGCYRLHPIEWNIGEAVGHLLAHCTTHRRDPHVVHRRTAWREAYQQELTQAGVRLAWPSPLPERG